jgi:glycerol-3-phosphate dehydrogenase (NAD(P)+)
MSFPLADRGHAVRLVGTHLDRHIIDGVKSTGIHPTLKATLPREVAPYHVESFAEALGKNTDLIILGVSSAGIPWAIDRLCETLTSPVPVLMITKGMWPEASGLKALPDHVEEELFRRRGMKAGVAAVGGPCIAGELAARRQTGTVITSRQPALARQACEMLETGYYHPRASDDVAGVEICAAFKNFFAIAVGWASGALETQPPAENAALNHNAAAILFDQAIVEMLALATALGGRPESVWGMPGAGDLYVTCQAGRNSRLGRHLGRGMTFAEAKAGPMKEDTVEGAELGIAVAKSINAMIASGRLQADALPLTLALTNSLTTNAPLDIPWQKLQRQGKAA